MTVNAGIVISVTSNELLKLFGGFRQVLDMERNVFNQTSSTRLAGSTYRWENTGTDGPILGVLFRSVSKMNGYMIFKRAQASFNRSDALIKFLQRTSFGFGQYSSQTCCLASAYRIFVLQENRVVDRRQALVVQQFRSLDYRFAIGCFQFLHGNHRPTCFLDGSKVKHGTSLVRIVVFRIHGHLRQEGQCTFRAYHGVSDDIERIIKADERQEVQTCHILDGILVTDTFRQLLIGPYSVTQFTDATDKFRMSRLK